jgi:hypothetical protein
MKKVDTKSFLIVFLMFCTFTFFAQSTSKNSDSNTKHKKIAQQNSPVTSTSATKVSEPQQNKYEKVNVKPTSYINEDDIYQGRQKEILNILTVKEIPADFPKYEKGKGIIWYNEQMDNYYRNHPDIITEQVRKKFGL